MLTESALLACMTYVDLNPIRAGIATTPEESDFTSIQRRIEQTADLSAPASLLLPFAREGKPEELPCSFADYLALVDWTGRVIRLDKRGHIPHHLAPVLQRLGIEEGQWLGQVTLFRRHGIRAIGDKICCQRYAAHCGQTRCYQPNP
ncbi:hypothetical protein [Aeromonas sp. 1HA1]|uniref:hypothetical protein n=1 Tax=Aeromonas sp. 1HA1 TaxID=2699193 RepID=UPI0031F5B324